MLKLVADVNCEGYMRDLLAVAWNSDLKEFLEYLDVIVLSLADIGLPINTNDRLIWETIQHHQAILLTNNRNNKGRNSLHDTIMRFNRSDAFPVVTLSNSERIYEDRNYANRVAQKRVEVLIDIEQHRGVGRLYIP